MEDRFMVIVDDDPEICETVSEYFRDRDFRVKHFLDTEGLISYLRDNRPDLVILDITLPHKSGLEMCRSLRDDDRFSDIPIIILSARNAEDDRVLGLNLGADDYVCKPFSLKELHARVLSVLRRSGTEEETRIGIGGLLELDQVKHRVTVKGEEVNLTAAEFKLLELFASRRDQVFSRDRILRYLWGEEKNDMEHTVDVHIWKLRKKLKEAGHLLKNVRGVGYKLSEAD